MSAPIRVVYVPHVQELIGQVQRDSDEIPYVPKSDYDALQVKLTESQRLNAVAKGFIVVSKDLLAEAIACNTDASLADARHIINSVLKVSDDEIFREALKELEQ